MAEAGLHVAAAVWSPVDALTRPSGPVVWDLPDERLGHRGNPAWPDHDARGFRNAEVPATAEVVTLGDSQTYGTNVARDEAWPAVLGRRTGRAVYNMAVPAHGTLQQERLVEAALALEPEVVVLAFYFGNDAFDNFVFARRRGSLGEMLDSAGLAEVEALEGSASIEDEARALFRSGAPEPPGAGSTGNGVLARGRDLLSHGSRLYGVLRALRRAMAVPPSPPSGLMAPTLAEVRATVSDRQLEHVTFFEGPEWRTVFTARYRLRVMDGTDPRIRVGLDAGLAALGRMRVAVEGAGARFVVVLMPTKEFVFAPRVTDPASHGALPAAWAAEAGMRERILDVLDAEGIEAVDPLDGLRTAPAQPYFENGDGHPDPVGHGVVAGIVAAALAGAEAPSP